LTQYVCSPLPPYGEHQPRGFETVRDLKIPADNSPKKSPDGHWLAFVRNWNIAVRASSGGEPILLSSDGST
jgi:Dipeptidyl peptidase IV (DPP IV) N-terminal region